MKHSDALAIADELDTIRLNVRTSDKASAELRRMHHEMHRLLGALKFIALNCGEENCRQVAKAALKDRYESI